MKNITRPSINFLLALLSFLNLTILPAVASQNSCCIKPAVESATAAESASESDSCMCSQMADCCQESSPTNLAVDRTDVTVKQAKNAQVPYNAPVWTPSLHVVRLAAVQPVFRKPVKQVHSKNKRYLELRVLLI